MSMNLFRLTGDMLHLLSIFLILWKMLTKRGCAGLSFKSQLLYSIVFATRYLDFYFTLYSPYLTAMKFFFLASSFWILYLMRVRFRASYDATGMEAVKPAHKSWRSLGFLRDALFVKSWWFPAWLREALFFPRLAGDSTNVFYLIIPCVALTVAYQLGVVGMEEFSVQDFFWVFRFVRFCCATAWLYREGNAVVCSRGALQVVSHKCTFQSVVDVTDVIC